jgi:NAD(P)-dependent dehydrogenase (short-subunit alcohol dehydrogenase family)
VLKNRVILVTGGASGIGLPIAQALAGHGAELIITGTTQAQIDDAVPKLGFYATGSVADVSKVADVERLISRIRATHGRLDVLIVTALSNCNPPIEEITEKAFDQTFNTSVKGAMFTVEAARPMMADGGSIVIVGDSAPIDQRQGTSLSRAAKSALQCLVEGWTMELKEVGVRVNLLNTGSAAPLIGSEQSDLTGQHFFCTKKKRWSYELSSAQREIVNVATFLASDTSCYLYGVELVVNKF